jgi:hypothetical protein
MKYPEKTKPWTELLIMVHNHRPFSKLYQMLRTEAESDHCTFRSYIYRPTNVQISPRHEDIWGKVEVYLHAFLTSVPGTQ